MSTLVSTHWATHVTTIHTAKSPTVGSQVLQFSGLCQLLFIVHFLEDSIETPGTAQWHFRLPHHGFGPEPFFGLRETSLSAWFKIIQNMSQHVSTIFKNNIVSSSFYAHWQTCHRDWPAMASLLTETTLAGQNKMYLKRQAQQTRAYSIQLHFCLVLAKMLGRVWPCFVFGLVDFGGLCTFLPCFLTPHGRSSRRRLRLRSCGSGSATKISGLSFGSAWAKST